MEKAESKNKSSASIGIITLVCIVLLCFLLFDNCNEKTKYYLNEKMQYDNIDITVHTILEHKYSKPSTNFNGYLIEISFELKNNTKSDFTIYADNFYIETEKNKEKYKTEQSLFCKTISPSVNQSYTLEYIVPYSISTTNYIMYFDWGLLHKPQPYYLYHRNDKNNDKLHNITIAQLINGEIIPTKQKARNGETILLNIKPNIGYELFNNTYYINDMPQTDNSFIMPDCDITINATFELTQETKKFKSTLLVDVESKFYTSTNDLYIKTNNNSHTSITAIKYLVIPLDAYGNNIKRYGYGVTQLIATSSQTISPNNNYTTVFSITGFTGISNLKIVVYSVLFSNGTEWGSSTAKNEIIKTFGYTTNAQII